MCLKVAYRSKGDVTMLLFSLKFSIKLGYCCENHFGNVKDISGRRSSSFPCKVTLASPTRAP